MWDEDGSRGLLAPAAASQRHRAGGASPLSRFASQPKALVTWRGVLRDWHDSLVTVGVLLIWGGLGAIFGGI